MKRFHIAVLLCVVVPAVLATSARGDGLVADCEFIERPTAAASADAERPSRRVIIPKLDEAPVVDGDLSDGVWKKAAVLEGFQRPRAAAIQRAMARSVRGDASEFLAEELTPPANQTTRGWVYYTATHLCLAFDMSEPELKSLRINAAVKDPGARDSAVWQDDDLELFLSPANDGRTFYQFGFNAAGVIYDGRGEIARTGGLKTDRAWNAEVRAASGRTPKSWTLEIMIPLSAMVEGDPTGMAWSFNAQRQRCAGEGKYGTLVMWSLVDASTVREPEHHGALVFGREPDIEVAQFGPQSPRFGANTLVARLRNRSERPLPAVCTAVFQPEKGEAIRLEKEVACPAKGEARAEWPYTLNATGTWSFEGGIRQAGRMVTWRQESFTLPRNLVELRLRDSLYYGTESLASAVLTLNVSPASLKDMRLELSLRSGTETVRKEEIAKVRSPEAVLSLNIGKLPAGGRCSVVARLVDAAGKTVAECSRELARVAGPFDAAAK